MLCALKIQSFETAGGELSYGLQITAKHAVGGAGGLLADEDTYATPADLIHALQRIGVSDKIIANAMAALQDESIRDRWVPIGTEEQIPFDTLTAHGFYMEERD
ncbi:hypothetical protein [Terriglobus sp.]|uniref:hypothetical protein n=1 Tax=Terriglobus sp. TaxID=1889013 RepID=UPI003B002883